MINQYFDNSENIILSFSLISHHTIEKKYYSNNKGFIRGSINFVNGYRLEFMEIKDMEVSFKDKYKYQLMDQANNLIFRYDNAPHHKSIKSFPHHKHAKTEIIGCREPDLLDILLEIRELIR